jgi:hypothetical protein
MGTRTPGLLHAINRQHIHRRTSPQATVPDQPLLSDRVHSSCGTSLLYFSRPRRPYHRQSAPTLPGDLGPGLCMALRER